MEFSYFDLRNTELRKVRAKKVINTDNYQINSIWEMESNVYFVIYQRGENKINEGPLFKCFIVDATKDEQSASVRQISLPLNNDPKTIEMLK